MGFAKDDALVQFNRVATGGAFYLEEGSAGVYLHIRHDHYFSDFAGKGSDDLSLHFHGFENGKAIADGDGISYLDRDGNDNRWGRSMHHASVVAVNLVRDAVHVNAGGDALADRNDMKFAAEDGQPGFELIQAVNVSLDANTVDLDAVISRANALGPDGIKVTAISQGEEVADVALYARTATRSRCVKLGLLYRQFGVVGVDGCLDQRYVGIFPKARSVFRGEAVEPADVDVSGLHFLAPEHLH